MDKNKANANRRRKRRIGIRKRVAGTPARPRLAIFRSLNHIYAQVIDDLDGKTLASASSRDKGADLGGAKSGNAKAAMAVGDAIAKKAKAAGISRVVFDRGGFRYHGRVKALADAARKGGLEF
jgi:large subunit ribosomal protein L18